MNKMDTRNKYFFGLGTIGRDMFYAFEANTIVYYMSMVLDLPLAVYIAASTCLTILRIFDALNDPITGLIIDNTRSRWGKYKPPMLIGALTASLFFLVMFSDFGLRNWTFVLVFGLAYICWDITYGVNDIAYWSMMPSLSLDQKAREKNGAFARICANIGMYIVMVGWQPILKALGGIPYENSEMTAGVAQRTTAQMQPVWFWFAIAVSVLMIGFQLFTIFGVKERKSAFKQEEKTTLKQMVQVLFKNDQLMWTTLSMALFMIGYCTTTGFAVYYMRYVYGDESMYMVLAAVVGIAQFAALLVFPAVSKRMSRRKMYTVSTIAVVVGYVVFFFADLFNNVALGPVKLSLVIVALAAVFIFIAQAFIQLLMLMFLADTIEYGQWKLHKRNDSVTFSMQPLINKIGGALATGFTSLTLVLAGIKTGEEAALSIPTSGQLILKLFMLVIPLVFIVAGYFIYRFRYKITPEVYGQIVNELKERGDIGEDADA